MLQTQVGGFMHGILLSIVVFPPFQNVAQLIKKLGVLLTLHR